MNRKVECPEAERHLEDLGGALVSPLFFASWLAPYNFGYIDGPLWTLTAQFSFYLAFPTLPDRSYSADPAVFPSPLPGQNLDFHSYAIEDELVVPNRRWRLQRCAKAPGHMPHRCAISLRTPCGLK